MHNIHANLGYTFTISKISPTNCSLESTFTIKEKMNFSTKGNLKIRCAKGHHNVASSCACILLNLKESELNTIFVSWF